MFLLHDTLIEETAVIDFNDPVDHLTVMFKFFIQFVINVGSQDGFIGRITIKCLYCVNTVTFNHKINNTELVINFVVRVLFGCVGIGFLIEASQRSFFECKKQFAEFYNNLPTYDRTIFSEFSGPVFECLFFDSQICRCSLNCANHVWKNILTNLKSQAEAVAV